MSRDYIDDPKEDAAWILRGIRDAAERIADTLDDYMEMSLGGIEATNSMRAADPAIEEALRPLITTLTRIRERRANR